MMLKKGTMRVDSELWELAVEKILLNLVDSETEAHEEIIRMLQDAQALEQDGLDVSRLGKYLDICLEKSAKSRQLYSDRALEQEAFSLYIYFYHYFKEINLEINGQLIAMNNGHHFGWIATENRQISYLKIDFISFLFKFFLFCGAFLLLYV